MGDCPGELNVITRKGKQGSELESSVRLLALKLEEWTTSQRMQVSSRKWERQGANSALEPQKQWPQLWASKTHFIH